MRLLTLFLLILLPPSGPLRADEWRDVVYLKNGSIIKGTIVEQIPKISLKVSTEGGNVYAYPMSSVEKIDGEKMPESLPLENANRGLELQERKKAYRTRAPGMAWFLSALYPGIGQYYNGDAVKGVAQQLFFTAGWLSASYYGTSYETRRVTSTYTSYSYTYDYSCYCYLTTATPTTSSYLVSEPYLNTVFYAGLGVAVAVSLWSQFDAPIRSAQRNREHAREYGHLLEWGSPRLALGFDAGAQPDGAALSKLTLHF